MKREGRGEARREGEAGRTYRALLRHENAAPRPTAPGRSASWETLTESRKMEPVVDTRSASLFVIFGADRPLRP